MDRFNGWVEPWRVARLKTGLLAWVNSALGDAHVPVEELQEQLTVVLPALTSMVLDKAVVREPGWPGTNDPVACTAACLALLKDGGLRLGCTLADLLDLDKGERGIMFLWDLALRAAQGRRRMPGLCQESSPAVSSPRRAGKAKSELLAQVREVIGERGTCAGADGKPLLNFTTDWADGTVLHSLLAALVPRASWPSKGLAAVAHKAEALLSVPAAIFEPEAFVDQPDECTLMLYVSEVLGLAQSVQGALGLLCSSRLLAALPPLEQWVSANGESSDADPVACELASLRKEVSEARAEADAAHARADELAAANRRLELELYDIDAEQAPLQTKVDELQTKLDAARAECESLAARLSEAQAQQAQAQVSARAFVAEVKAERAEAEAKLRSALERSQGLAKRFKIVQKKLQVAAADDDRNDCGVAAPTGRLTLMFTDIQGSTALWESDAEVMAAALAVHNNVVREGISRYAGYEVKTEGDAFMIAFRSAMDAIACAVFLQSALLRAAWPEALLDASRPLTRPEHAASGELIWRGLRVRMGIHLGTPQSRLDPVTGRMDYFGPMVNRAARVEGLASGGQIVVSDAVQAEIAPCLAGSSAANTPVVAALGSFELKGIATKMAMYSVTSPEHMERTFETDKGHHRVPFQFAPEGERADGTALDRELAFMSHENTQLLSDLANLESELVASETATIDLVSRFEAQQSMVGADEAVRMRNELARLSAAAVETAGLLESMQTRAREVADLATNLEEQMAVFREHHARGGHGCATSNANAYLAARREIDAESIQKLKAKVTRLKARLQQEANAKRALRRYMQHVLKTGNLDDGVRSDLVSALASLEAGEQGAGTSSGGALPTRARRDSSGTHSHPRLMLSSSTPTLPSPRLLQPATASEGNLLAPPVAMVLPTRDRKRSLDPLRSRSGSSRSSSPSGSLSRSTSRSQSRSRSRSPHVLSESGEVAAPEPERAPTLPRFGTGHVAHRRSPVASLGLRRPRRCGRMALVAAQA
ncbi:adenylate and guanylate cyclase catalytic domain-containing protein [Thecamonas trahens ATCC 50062]|uniref:Adenylate and guanylate cyclase catalytic domain-containing protein n=1 Tax=Thecamonas trahens ATCC 50062 TaxID=461836 RepID=A0A0L0D8G2_THETB|nr:adenylate and guanylate cyclase catalytic domain-containing protein [Thecamonas trahens ATCC 50062]KNC48624.1 adenylate and guanylate cyclase catalytic domain-containing protein [Thecamonas trahens ATCC 50062]|eukprot:XP_013762680.1 adenylate and guanylate cyclase catalytic domain-containing protein [Thecamonas trahens ATCC 50062]